MNQIKPCSLACDPKTVENETCDCHKREGIAFEPHLSGHRFFIRFFDEETILKAVNDLRKRGFIHRRADGGDYISINPFERYFWNIPYLDGEQPSGYVHSGNYDKFLTWLQTI